MVSKVQHRAFFMSEAELRYKEHQQAKEEKKKEHKASRPSVATVYNCETCGLQSGCRTPKMKRFGKGQRQILLIGEAPGADEDRIGRPFVGRSGQELEQALRGCGIDMDRDCIRTNVLRCRPPGNRDPENKEKKSCFQFLEEDIQQTKPKLIICLGDPSTRAVLRTQPIRDLGPSLLSKIHGWVFPNHTYNCWIGCSYHPAHTLYDPRMKSIFIEDMKSILSYLDKPLPQILTNEGNELITESSDAEDLLKTLSNTKNPTAFDYETNSQTSPYNETSRLLTVSLSDSIERGWCIWLDNPDWSIIERAWIYHCLKDFILSSTPKLVQNFNMEESWSRTHVGASIINLEMDTMVASHVVNCRRGTTSLDLQVLKMTGHYYSDMVDPKKMEEVPIERLSDYTCWDSRYTRMAYQVWNEILNRESSGRLREFYAFLHSCLPCLMNFRERGIPIDPQAIKEFDKEYEQKVQTYASELATTAAGKKFKAKFETDINVDSPKHLNDLLYDIYNTRVVKSTEKGNKSVDADVLKDILRLAREQEVKEAVSIILDYKRAVSFRKRLREYSGVISSDNKLHPSFNLNVAETYRSSSTDPNVQNMFKRDPELVQFRRLIIPSPGNIIAEADQNGLETRTAGMVTRDPVLIQQIKDGIDTHRRWAARLYEKPPEEISSDERFSAKNSFVFASLYGSQPDPIAKSLELDKDHVTNVWNQFWEEYHYIKEWQLRILAEYEQHNYVETVTGFRRPGPLSNEQLFNTPIQGPAFHIVLAGLKKTDKILTEEGFKTVLNSEIHDAPVFDMVPNEAEDVIELSTAIMCSRHFDWMRDVPLSLSWAIGKNFYEMEEI